MKKAITLTTLVILSIAGAFLVYSGYKAAIEIETKIERKREADLAAERAVLVRRQAAWKKLKRDLALEIKGFNGTPGIVIKDLSTNWEVNQHKDLLIPSASVVKIPIMFSYFYASNEGKMDLGAKLTISNSDKVQGSGTLKFAASGQEYSIESLIEMMVTASDNTAANMLIDHMGFKALNDYFKKLGLKHTNISRNMMDFSERKDGVENYTTAGDIAYLMEQVYRGRFINKDISMRCLDILADQKVNDRIPKALPKGTVVAHKTGLEKGLCHDAGIVYTDKGNYLICVLVKHKYKSAQAAKKLICGLSLLVYNYYANF